MSGAYFLTLAVTGSRRLTENNRRPGSGFLLIRYARMERWG